MANRACQRCGKSLEGKRSVARFCSDLCRKRAQRSRQAVDWTEPEAAQPDAAEISQNSGATSENSAPDSENGVPGAENGPPGPPDGPPGESPGGSEFGRVARAAEAELMKAGKDGSSAGQALLALARRLDQSDGEPGSSLAALAREFRAGMTELLAGDDDDDDELSQIQAEMEQDELAARRDRSG